MALTREQIFGSKDLGLERQEVPEWPGEDGDPGVVFLRVLSGTDREAMERIWTETEEKIVPNAREKMLVRTMCDEEGTRLFEDDDIELLALKNSIALDRLFRRSMQMNGLSKTSVEDAAKN